MITRIEVSWTEADFVKATGRNPENDDLDRANCKEAGNPSHKSCGVCEHGLPVFMCTPCFINSSNKTMSKKTYLGDGLYATLDGNMIILTAENGIHVTNVVFLDPYTLQAFLHWLKKNQLGQDVN